MNNKEFGSDFHHYNGLLTGDNLSIIDEPQSSFFFSGRVALYNLLSYGALKYGWKKVGFPSYYCHEVVDFCKKLPIKIVYYNHNPFEEHAIDWEDDTESVFINVNYFGISKLKTSFIKQSVLIEDVTHNLMAYKNSDAHYCFGSLRKQLPLPAGGFVYDSTATFKNQVVLQPFAEEIARKKYTAMQLKSNYLKGEGIDKPTFRKLFIDAEKAFESENTNSALPPFVSAMLKKIPAEQLIKKTISNIQYFKSKWEENSRVKLLESKNDSEMGLVLLCKSQAFRDRLKSAFIQNNIYPAILWPHQKNEIDIAFENRMLFVHADFRYTHGDMDYILKTIKNDCTHV